MMQIDWWTFALQAINFLVLVWLLWRFLYRPVRDVIEKRKALADQAFADADRQKMEAEAARKRFEDGRAGLATEREKMLDRTHGELEAERDAMVKRARSEADQLIEAARKSIEEERKAAVADIRKQAAVLAVELATDLLRTASGGGPNDTFLAQLETHLEGLPADERERLQNDLAGEGTRLTVVTATPLTPEERHQWTDLLSAQLGRENETDFESDPDILGGAELRFPHAVLRFTWAEQLQKARELLLEDEPAS